MSTPTWLLRIGSADYKPAGGSIDIAAQANDESTMSLLPVEEITYVDCVTEFFTSLKGSGLMLSPLDVELVRGYEAAGIPWPVVCRGIQRAFEARRRNARRAPSGEAPRPPRSLRSCRRSIEAEARKFLKGAPGRTAPPVSPGEIDRLLAHARHAADPAERAAYREAYRAACVGSPLAPAAALRYLAALPRPAQRRLCGDVGRRLTPRPHEMTRLEQRLRLREALIDEALSRARLDLPGPP
jgi:hypothetical protein